ncbi:MAG: MFS transporter [Boseongicola sp.]|nr:MFS transporter [Boseongicola sp.]
MTDMKIADSLSVPNRRVIVGSIAASIAFVMELTLVPLLLPGIQEQFALSIGQLAWVFNSYGISVAVGVLLGGLLGDVYKATRVFAAGVICFATGAAIVAFAGSYELMIVGRVLQGFGGGVFSPLIPLLLTRSSPHRPGKVLIIWGSLAGYVAAFAPFFYGNTLAENGWTYAFVIIGIVSLIALAIVWSARLNDRPPSFDRSLSSYAELLKSGRLWVMLVYVFCTYGAITYFLFRLPLWLAENGFQVASIGFTLSVMWLSFSFVSTLLRNLVDEPHVRMILMAAPVLIAAGFPIAYIYPEFAGLIVSSILVGSGLACSNAPSTQLILKFAPRGMGAASASLDITCARLGGVVTVALMAQSMLAYSFITIAAMSLVAFACALVAAKRFG